MQQKTAEELVIGLFPPVQRKAAKLTASFEPVNHSFSNCIAVQA
jgi:hypothetical protein